MNAIMWIPTEDRAKLLPSFINPIVMIWIVIFVMFAMWIYLLIQSLHDNKSKKKIIFVSIVIVIAFAICYFLMSIHQSDFALLACLMPALSLIFMDEPNKEE